MAIQTWALVPADVSARIAELVIDTASTPTDTTVDDEIIPAAAARVQLVADQLGIDTTTADGTNPTHRVLKEATLLLSICEVLRGMERADTELAQAFCDQGQAILDRLLANPAAAGASRVGRVFSHVTDRTAFQTELDDNGFISERMIASRSM